MLDASGMSGELEAFPEGFAASIRWIVDGDALATVACHHSEAGDVCGAIPDVDHVFKWDRTLIWGHVIVHVLVVVEHALVDAKEELGFRGV